MKATSYAMDLNEILGGDFDQPILEQNMVCPEILSRRGPNDRNNWCSDQCDLRVRISAPCTFKCKLGRKIRAAYEAKGYPYLEDQDHKINSHAETPLNKVKGKHKVGREVIGAWGKLSLLKRNVEMVTAALNGVPAKVLAENYKVSIVHVRQIIRTYCKLSNGRIYKQFRGPTNELIHYLIGRNDKFIPHFPDAETANEKDH